MSIGVFAIGAVLGSQALLEQNTSTRYAASNPANAIIYAEDIPQSLVENVVELDGVALAESRRKFTLRLNVQPSEWRSLTLTVFPNNEPGTIGKISHKEGLWPPEDKGLVLEQSALIALGVQIGDVVFVETVDRVQRSLPIIGTVHNSTYRGPLFSGNRLEGYITDETFVWLGQPASFVELHIMVTDKKDDRSYIADITSGVIRFLEQTGQTILNSRVPIPGEYGTKPIVDSMLAVLGILGLLTTVLGCGLVVNAFNALLLEQIREIGVMKSIGAQTYQLIFMYVALALLYGIVTLILSIPVAILFSNILASYVAELMNFESGHFSIPKSALIIPALLSITMPVLVTLLPIWKGSRLSVRQTLAQFSATSTQWRKHHGGHFLVFNRKIASATSGSLVPSTSRGSEEKSGQIARGRAWFISLSEWVIPSRLLGLAFRNSFRRYGRLSLTLATLAIGGAMIISVLSLQKSLASTLDDLQRYFLEDIQVSFDHSYRSATIEQQMSNISGIARVEHWSRSSARVVYDDESESSTLALNAIPIDSRLLQPTITAGKWLTTENPKSLVIGSDVARQEKGIQVGQTVRMRIDGRESEWFVNGIALAVGNNPAPVAYVNKSEFDKKTRSINRSNVLKIVTDNQPFITQASIINRIEERFERSNVRIRNIQTQTQLRDTIQSQFSVLIIFLAVMCVMIIFVGGIGLTGMLSMNVIERQREIGIMRSIGASNRAIQFMIIAEGVVISFAGWLLSIAIALPFSRILNSQVGTHLLNAPVIPEFSKGGLVVWLFCSVLLAIIASLLPALRASRLTVREVLAYE